MADLSVKEKTSSSVKIKLSGMSESYTGNRNYYWYKKLSSSDNWGSSVKSDSSTGIQTELEYTFTGLEASTSYDFRCAIQYWSGGGTEGWTRPSIYKIVTEAASVKLPDPWAWSSTKTKGQSVKITASEWNDFTSKIDEFRVYKGKEKYSYTFVERGDPISASVCLEAYNAIYEIANSDDMPEIPFKGNQIKASFFNDLRDALNNVK